MVDEIIEGMKIGEQEPGSSLRVLAVEDELHLRKLYGVVFSGVFGKYDLLESGEEALLRLKSGEDNYNVLMTDYNLGQGKINGGELAGEAKRFNPDLIVVLLSGVYKDRLTEKERGNFDIFLHKSDFMDSREKLVEEIKEKLSSRVKS